MKTLHLNLRSRMPRIVIPSVAALAAILISAHPAKAVDRTWDGEAGDGLWGTATNWVGDTRPTGTTDSAYFGVSSSFGTTVNSTTGFTTTGVSAFYYVFSNTTSVATLDLGRNFFTQSGNGMRFNVSGTAQTTGTLSNAGQFVLNLNGFNFNPIGSSSGGNATGVQAGTLNFNTAGSQYVVAQAPNTGDRNLTFGTATAQSIVNVTSSGTIGRINTVTTVNTTRSGTYTFSSNSTLNVTNNAPLTIINQARTDSTLTGTNTGLRVNTDGIVNLGAGSSIAIQKVNSSTVADANQLGFVNHINSGTLNQGGTISYRPEASGTATVTNNGTWRVAGTGARIVDDRAATNTNVLTFNSATNSTISGSSSADRLEFDTTNNVGEGDSLAMNVEGRITAGNGANGGSGSIGDLQLSDIDLALAATATTQIDFLSPGNFDSIRLTTGVTDGQGAGTLSIVDGTNFQLYYASTPPDGPWAIDIYEYGTVTGVTIDDTYDLAGNFEIFNATGDAADISNYELIFHDNVATLYYLVPEPSVGVLWLLGVAGLSMSRRRRKA